MDSTSDSVAAGEDGKEALLTQLDGVLVALQKLNGPPPQTDIRDYAGPRAWHDFDGDGVDEVLVVFRTDPGREANLSLDALFAGRVLVVRGFALLTVIEGRLWPAFYYYLDGPNRRLPLRVRTVDGLEVLYCPLSISPLQEVWAWRPPVPERPWGYWSARLVPLGSLSGYGRLPKGEERPRLLCLIPNAPGVEVNPKTMTNDDGGGTDKK